MKRICLLLLFVTVTVSLSKSQTLSPTELESAVLAKLKAQHEEKQGRLNQLDTQILLLQVTRRLAQQEEQVKLSELQGKAEQIIKDHKWEAVYNLDQTETGSFAPKPVVGTPSDMGTIHKVEKK